jgi:CRP/FNR family transcriptional regulator, cyclic AMP receptor protein
MSRRQRSGAGTGEVVAALGQVGLFQGLPRKTLQFLADMSREHTFAAGDEIVVQGERSGRFYLIMDGGAEVQVNGVTINVLGPGQHFGEYAVIDEEPRTATVRATTPVRAYSLSPTTLRSLLKEDAELTYRLLRNACQRVRTLQTNLA